MRKLIKKLIKESNEQLKFTSIEVEIFSFSSDNTIDYETGSRGGQTFSTPKDKRIKIKITPVLDLSIVRKAKPDFYEEFELDGVIVINDFNDAILCQEGIFCYQNESDSDCDGTCKKFGSDFIPHKKISKWNEIKQYVKSILKQSDIENAIRNIGDFKQLYKITGYTGLYHFSPYAVFKELKNKNKIQWFERFYEGTGFDGPFIFKMNNKFGLGYANYYDKIGIIIPVVYDSFYRIKNQPQNILFKKGNKIYNWGRIGRNWKIVSVKDLSQEIEIE